MYIGPRRSLPSQVDLTLDDTTIHLIFPIDVLTQFHRSDVAGLFADRIL